MTKTTFCTIITADFIPYALTLHESLRAQDETTELNVLISDKKTEIVSLPSSKNNLTFTFAEDVCKQGVAKKVWDKYAAMDMDRFRWSMKPIFIGYLIEEHGYDKVLFSDPDIVFFDEFDFLIDNLDAFDILLTPHWRSSDREKDPQNFDLLYVGGLFNGGFVGVNRGGLAAMKWWAKACESVCEKDFSKGRYVDQTHLNLLPILFDNVKIVKHKGCNVANWNQVDCPRVLGANGEVLIEGKWPIVFIHFTESTVHGIEAGKDLLLKRYFEKQQKMLRRNGWNPQESKKIESWKLFPGRLAKLFR